MWWRRAAHLVSLGRIEMPPNSQPSHLRRVGVALALGFAFQFVLDALYRYGGGHIVQFVFDIGKALGLDEGTLRAFVLTAAPACEASLLGILFGVPLGLVVPRHVLGYWLLFVSAVLTMQILTVAMTGSPVGWLVAVWTFPITWLNMLAILGVALATVRYRHPTTTLAQCALTRRSSGRAGTRLLVLNRAAARRSP